MEDSGYEPSGLITREGFEYDEDMMQLIEALNAPEETPKEIMTKIRSVENLADEFARSLDPNGFVVRTELLRLRAKLTQEETAAEGESPLTNNPGIQILSDSESDGGEESMLFDLMQLIDDPTDMAAVEGDILEKAVASLDKSKTGMIRPPKVAKVSNQETATKQARLEERSTTIDDLPKVLLSNIAQSVVDRRALRLASKKI